LRIFVREQGVQTNETQRCVALAPAFLGVARATGLPLELIELGPSAGLNLVFDRYRFRYAEGVFGDPNARLSFDVTERGHVPAGHLETPLEIRRRRGIDLAPIDVTTDSGVLLLRSFLWPGLAERSTRLDAAIQTFREAPQPPELIRGDYVDLLPAVLAARPADALTVVFQTASIGYLSEERYATLRRGLEDAGADGRPLAWISSRRHQENETDVEPVGWELEVRVWPESSASLVALADFHGNWLDWLAA
jgi:hypothetical protein